MKHLYQNDEGEMVVADTLEQAAEYHDIILGGNTGPLSGWTQVGDEVVVPIGNEDGTSESRTAKEWAEGWDEPTQIATTYH